MCDFGCEGVWDREGAAGLAGDLPVEPALAERLRAWNRCHDANDAFRWSPPGYEGDPAGLSAFAAEGRAIAEAVKRALPDATVILHDHAAAAAPGASRWSFEVEIGPRPG